VTSDWLPAVLAVAPNGARKTKADHPAVPLTPGELAATAAACKAAGAAMIPLHVREGGGGHSLDAGLYGEAIAAVRAAVGDGLMIQMTTESVGRYSPAEQMAAVRAVMPEAVSLAVRELLADGEAELAAAPFLAEMAEADVALQYILYDATDLDHFETLLARRIIPRSGYSLLFVLGRYSPGQRSQPADLLPFLAAGGGRHPWAVCAFGPKETACAAAAAALGGHARVGFENNLLLPDGQTAADNATLVAATAQAIRALGRPLADAETARRLLRAGAAVSAG